MTPIKESAGIFESRGIRYLFLPLNCSELAPVEFFFSQLKRSVLRDTKDLVKLNKSKGFDLMERQTERIPPNRIKRLFDNFTEVLYSLLEDARNIL